LAASFLPGQNAVRSARRGDALGVRAEDQTDNLVLIEHLASDDRTLARQSFRRADLCENDLHPEHLTLVRQCLPTGIVPVQAIEFMR
jgi:hypothetical protein